MTSRPLSSIASELLVLHCQGGDERAFAVLYEHWTPRLARHAARLTGRPDAVADIVGEAWLAIVKGLPGLDDPAAFPAWAYRITGRRCADWIRRRRRAGAGPLTDEPAAAPNDDAGGGGADEIARLRRAIRELSADHRAVISLHYGEGLGVRDIAAALDVPPGTVQSRLHHARLHLSRILERTPS